MLERIYSRLKELLSILFHTFFGGVGQIALVASIVVPLIFIGSELASMEEHNDGNPNVDSSYLDEIKTSIKKQFEESPGAHQVSREVDKYNGILTTYKIIVTGAKPSYDDHIEYTFDNKATLKKDSLVSFLGMWVMIVYTLFVIKRSDFKRRSSEITDNSNTISNADEITGFACTDVVDHISAIKNDLEHARRKANDVYQRSTLLLVGGVVMAFVGIGIFYNSTPLYSENPSSQEMLLVNLRPTLMLIFIEALAWFLLKQYRALADEHRYFNRIASKKSAYLVAFMAPNIDSNSDLYQRIITGLLQDESQSILKQGETTEQLESTKLLNSNPVFEFYSTLIQMFNNKSKNKSDG